jgi:hypothetical protein
LLLTITLIVIYLGLDSLFLFKSVSPFLPSCRSSLAHSFGSAPSFVLFLCFFIPWALVRRSLSTHYTPEALLNHVFGDLRKPKAPNRLPYTYTKEARQGNTTRPLPSSTFFRKPPTVFRKSNIGIRRLTVIAAKSTREPPYTPNPLLPLPLSGKVVLH